MMSAPARERFGARLSLLGASAVIWGLAGCSSGGGDSTGDVTTPPEDGAGSTAGAELQSVVFGRLVDVYGLATTNAGVVLSLYQSDVVIGTDISDERPSGSSRADRDVEYDFLAVDPETLTSRLLIPREIGSADFNRLFAGLSANLKNVTASVFGQDTAVRPFTVVPRNAALKLTFSSPLQVGEDFFVARDDNGNIIGVRNTEAVQLLSITGDPTDNSDEGDFQLIPTRVVPRGRELIIDTVFLGSEGVAYGTRNNAAGMPGSGDQFGANVRIALALEGPLRIPGLKAATGSVFVGTNNDAARSIVRDFRSGNEDDDGTDIANGFIRDTEPPRIVGAIPFLLVGVNDLDTRTQVARVYKNARTHEIDRGDILRFVDTNTGVTVLTEVSDDPEDDRAAPDVQYVDVPVRRVPGLAELDPRSKPGYPNDPESASGQAWLRQNAPRAVLVCEFTARRVVAGVEPYGDDPTNFLTFSPLPLPQVAGYDPFPGQPSPPNVNVSPFASAIVRFTKPVNLETVKAFDTFFFATRDVLSEEAQEAFKDEYSVTNAKFSEAKFITPHLVDARVFDESGSQTTLRLQPVKGFYLDEEMRQILPPEFVDGAATGQGTANGPGTQANPAPGLPGNSVSAGSVVASMLPYYLHLLGGNDGIKDLAGNSLDFQAEGDIVDSMTIPFTLDARKRADGRPFFEDNLVVSIVRRFAATDEDEQPSLYRIGVDSEEYRFDMSDFFGAVSITSKGRMVARPATRVTKVVDNINQQPPPPAQSLLRWCPEVINGDGARASNTAAVAFGQGIQNPLNPYGSRLQTVWREIDMSLSRSDPFDFNLDVEQMYWAPVTTASIFFDIFDEVSLYLGHSEYRPEPCVGQFSALPVFPNSGLQPTFAVNYAHNQLPIGAGSTIDQTENPAPHPAYEGVQMTIAASQTVLEPNRINRFLPLPEFQKPYFVWRDETSIVQGGMTREGRDTDQPGTGSYDPYILSPWLAGGILPQQRDGNNIVVNSGFWDNRRNFHLNSGSQDGFTGGLVGAIALPLLADFQTFCDQPDLPAGNGFIANGFNGWQISLTVQSSPTPDFRVFSGGTPGTGCVGPSDTAWQNARGQPPQNSNSDNSLYWTMADFLKRQTVATVGFVEILNPHRMPDRGMGDLDPRLGPWFPTGRPSTIVPRFEWHFEPPLDALPNGTAIVPEFRAASRVTAGNWAVPNPGPDYQGAGSYVGPGMPNPAFALNPYVSGDAHIKKYDRRPFPSTGGQSRNWWSRYYTEHITDYTTSVNDVMSTNFLDRFSGPNANDNLTPDNVVYFNWRFVMTSNTESSPPVSPSIDSFAISYRFERVQ